VPRDPVKRLTFLLARVRQHTLGTWGAWRNLFMAVYERPIPQATPAQRAEWVETLRYIAHDADTLGRGAREGIAHIESGGTESLSAAVTSRAKVGRGPVVAYTLLNATRDEGA
jgi:hypothetical protein